MRRLAAVRAAVSGVSAGLCTSELAFAAAQQSQAGSLAAVALHDLVLLILMPLARRLRLGGGRRAVEAAGPLPGPARGRSGQEAPEWRQPPAFNSTGQSTTFVT